MRYPIPNITTIIGLIMSASVFSGCAPQTEAAHSGRRLDQMISSQRSYGQSFADPFSGGLGLEPALPDATGTEATDEAAPLALLGTTPNPFNPATELSFAVPAGGGAVTLAIYGLDGRRARQLVAAELAGGEYSVTWYGRDDNGHKLPSGVYFASLRSGDEVRVQKLVMVQ